MNWDLRELLELAVDEPPRWLHVTAIRRRAARRRATQAGSACAAAVVVIGLGATLSGGAIRHSGQVVTGPAVAAPPRYYLAVHPGSRAKVVFDVRQRIGGKVIATVRTPSPGLDCGGGIVGIAAAAGRAFFMTCSARPARGVKGELTASVYRFSLTRSGQVTRSVLVKGSVIKGVLPEVIAAAPDGSELAIEVLRPPPTGPFSTSTVPEGVFVINTKTGRRALWRSGPYVPGALQFASAQDLSFTGDGHELVVNEARCLRSRLLTKCNGHADAQVRAYSPAAAGGSLEKGRVLLSEPGHKGGSLTDAVITPDGSTLTRVSIACPRKGTCTLSVDQLSAATGRVVRNLYVTRTGSPFEGVFLRFFSVDPSGRYLILDAGAGSARVNGWIDHGKLVPLTPADGNAPDYESW